MERLSSLQKIICDLQKHYITLAGVSFSKGYTNTGPVEITIIFMIV